MAVRVINHVSVSVRKPAQQRLKRLADAYGMKMYSAFDLLIEAWSALSEEQREALFQRLNEQGKNRELQPA